MRKRDRWFNSVLIVLTTSAVGAWLVLWPLDGLMRTLADQIRAGRDWLAMIVGCAFVAGFFVSRVVDDAFESIFSRAPFSEIGADMPAGKDPHPGWVDWMLRPVGYGLFVGRVALTMFCLMVVVRLVVWAISAVV